MDTDDTREDQLMLEQEERRRRSEEWAEWSRNFELQGRLIVKTTRQAWDLWE